MKTTIYFITFFLLTLSSYCQKKKIEITYKKNSDKSISFSFKKNVPGSYYLILEFDKLTNTNNSTTFKKVIKHNSGSLFTLNPANKKKGISFSYKVKYRFGNPNPKLNHDIVYALPFKTGKDIKIIEASNIGEKYFGSEKPIDWKSFIVYTKKPDSIYAMRKGKVVKIIKKYTNDATVKKSYTSKRNRILIEHEDGSYSGYKGFDKNQIFVKLGQEVYPHTPLGKLEKFNDKKYRLDFNSFHYLKNIINDEKITLKNRKHKIKYLNPNFFVSNEIKKITSKESYSASFNEEIKLQEFSKREKKKYKKNPNKYK